MFGPLLIGWRTLAYFVHLAGNPACLTYSHLFVAGTNKGKLSLRPPLWCYGLCHAYTITGGGQTAVESSEPNNVACKRRMYLPGMFFGSMVGSDY